MQTNDNKNLIRRWTAFASEGFPGNFDAFIAGDYVGHLGETEMDLAELERVERAFASAFPGMQHSIDDLIAESDRVAGDLPRYARKANSRESRQRNDALNSPAS